MEEQAVLTIAGIATLSIACQWFAWWVKLPAILFLLIAGILVGPVTGLIHPDELFGDLLFPFVSLSVAVILFEGSLTLQFSQISGLQNVVRRMVTTGLLVTWTVVTLSTWYWLDFPFELALLFGALTVVTGPTVIVPMLRTVRPNARIASILRWEGIVIDPIGALLAVLVFEFIVSGQSGEALGKTLVSFANILLVGVVIGAAAGYVLGLSLRNHWLPEYLQNIAVLATVFAVFAISNEVESEAGLLTVTVMGLWLANMRKVPIEGVLDFKESLSVVLISTLFIVLAARIDFDQFRALGWGALGVLAAIQFIARPLKIMLATYGSSLTWRERGLLAWIAPRGIVAAAVAALFSLRLQNAGYEQAELIVPMIFLVIIGTVVLQSATARGLALLLKVAEPEARGFLIIGANPVARTIALALKKQGYDSLLCDNSWPHISAARMQGLSTFYGSAVSQYADRKLDLVGLGRLLAMSTQQERNILAVHRYRREFGDKHVYTLLTRPPGGDSKQTVELPAGYTAFGEDVSYERLAHALSIGAEIRETRLSENFDFDAYSRKYDKRAVPLFALDPKKRLHIFTAEQKVTPGPDWKVLSLIEPEAEDEESALQEGIEDGGDGAQA